ncbi:SDR family NAD(P)-dependent oxidoreductase [Algoriphagus sp. D3-2-R+10]|uniref:SDR family NAD(P)-dependent oxidoreductase n=1 Tax=Algoriphagus aurantiacus TaxID=3103948 RepID=UPI002B3974D5|nr:SDR family NAD(P)-dependent oxidoreductase [Algoriphagus sp. D3-2-R+10]MEB2778654.1 SDR family NAD(P)-dependent oxidoreductase [Algoriphagus sp. D3-2-R+10]
MKKYALITGATSGIGRATAEAFAEQGINLIICGRRNEKLEALKQELQNKVAVEIMSFNVCSREEVQVAFASLPNKVKNNINILLNNAGGAHGLDLIQDGNYDDWEQMIDSNVKGLLYVSEAVIPVMIKNKEGHIVNMSSVAGKEVYAKGNVYCAAKHAVEAISQGMRIDLIQHGLKVSNIAPGAVNTEFSTVRFKNDIEKADNVYKGFTPLAAKDIAEVITFIVTRPHHVNIADISILPLAQASTTVFNST